MTKEETIELIQFIIDEEILDIPNGSYIQYEYRENYADHLFNRLVAAGVIVSPSVTTGEKK